MRLIRRWWHGRREARPAAPIPLRRPRRRASFDPVPGERAA